MVLNGREKNRNGMNDFGSYLNEHAGILLCNLLIINHSEIKCQLKTYVSEFKLG